MFTNTKIESPYYYIYEIKKGDTLYKLSKEFNVNTMLLSELNGLNIDDYIYPGQMVLIPKKDVSYYITKEGDTLKLISKTIDLAPGDDMIEFSSVSKKGREEVLAKIESLIVETI